ncbi:unnamed protein product, partial [Rotaria sp. Silwood1]
MRIFVDQLIPEVMNYRRQQIKEWMIEKFKQEFPIENNNVKERKTKFLNTMEQYMLSFKSQICLKKCSVCDLKCIKNSQHTQETKFLLEKKKEELKNVQTSLETIDLINIHERTQKLNQDIYNATLNENNFRQQMNLLSNELKCLTEKEKIDTQNNECDSKIAIEHKNIQDFQQNINDIAQQLKTLLPNKEDFQDTNELLQNLDEELLLLLNPTQYNSDQLNILIDSFHTNYEKNNKPEIDLFFFSMKEETNESIDYCQRLTPLFFSMMTKNIDQIFNYSIFIKENLEYIEKQLNASKENLNNTESRIKELEQEKNTVRNQKEDTTQLIEKDTKEYEEIVKKLTDINIEKENLSKKINDIHQLDDTMNSSIIEKIEHYIKDLQDKRNNSSYSYNCNDHEKVEKTIKQETQKLQFFLDEKNEKECIIATNRKEIETSNDNIRIQQCREQIHKNEENIKILTEKIYKEQLNKQLYDMNSTSRPINFTNTQECNEKYQQIVKEYENASLCNKNLKQELFDIGIYSRLTADIIYLEKEAQNNCNCGTDHKCSGICRICAEEDITKQNLCVFSAGHYGEHKCNAGHMCTKFCQICEIYGFSNNRCRFAYEHKEPEHHQCERVHQCPATCICSDPCAIPLELTQHNVHQCNKKNCWKSCIFSCGNLCATEDHNHDMTTGLVTITINRETHQVKKHLCNQSHYCKGICDAPGVCKQEYKTQQRKWTTESGEEFIYDHIEVEEVRDKCGIQIPAGKSSHDDITNHRCDGQHTCQERCPDCGSFCKNPQGHDGFHRTLHRNKEQHIFTSTNPTDQIEIRSSEQE